MYQYDLNICTHEERDPKLNIFPLESTCLTTAQVILFPGVRPWEQPQAFIGDEKKNPCKVQSKMYYFGLNLDVYYIHLPFVPSESTPNFPSNLQTKALVCPLSNTQKTNN